MVRSTAVSIENNFSKGLITEATALNYPENSVVETDNCIYSKNGRVIRRYGIDYEDAYAITTFADMDIYDAATTPSDIYNTAAIQEYEWNTVNNDGNLSFVVVQIGNVINFLATSFQNNLSNNRKSFTIDLTDYQVPTYTSDDGQYVGAVPVSMYGGFGYLFIVHPLCEPIYVSYDSTTDDITVTEINIRVRDFDKIEDGTTRDNERPASLTDAHEYNLYNQGWGVDAKNAGGTTTNVIDYWDANMTNFPSNADIWFLFKNSSSLIDKDLFSTRALGNTPAPNGHFIYNAFDIDRDAEMGTTGLPSLSSGDYRPSATAFYSGRVFYAGVQANGYGSKVYFSKVVESARDFGKCFQRADPTSEENSELLPTDGGVIDIPDIAIVLRMVPVGNNLLVFATNGIWSIFGRDGIFAANDYNVNKVSSVSLAATNSVVVAEGIPLWWDTAGIYTMAFDPSTGKESIQNISESTIQSLIDEIPEANIAYVKGVYNNIDKNIHWLYKTGEAEDTLDNYNYDKLLVLNIVSQSFSVATISSSEPKVGGIVFTSKSKNDPLISTRQASLVKYLTHGAIGTDGAYAFTVSQFNDDTYHDWVTYDDEGIDAESYFITGYRIRGELFKKWQSNYIVVVMDTEDDASAFLQGIWDYANSGDGGRFTSRQQVYRDDVTKDYSRAKVKMRGNGYSLQLKFSSEEGKPFSITGWATADSGTNVP
jgi:hypothetical protein